MSARLRNLNPYELHKYLVNIYCLSAKGSTGHLKRDCSRDRTDLDVIRENHKFLWEDDDVADTWEKQLAKKYYDKLFKEYCICDLSRFKENKVSFPVNVYRICDKVIAWTLNYLIAGHECIADVASQQNVGQMCELSRPQIII